MITQPIGNAWKRQRELKKQDIPEQAQVYNLAKQYDNLMERCLFILTYLTAGRISEIVHRTWQYKHQYEFYLKEVSRSGTAITHIWTIKRNQNGSPKIALTEKFKVDQPGIRKQDIMFTEKDNKQLMIVSIRNLKNKKYIRKNLPIPIHKEADFIQPIRDYLDTIQESETELFSFNRRKAQTIINKVGLNPHFLRDIRLTHLITIYDFNTFMLQKWAGWQNATPAERYVRLGYSDLISKF